MTVPDDFKTIQQAIASGANEILVRAGTYPETLVIDDIPVDPATGEPGDLVVRGLAPVVASADSIPVLAGLVLENFPGFVHDHSIVLEDLAFSKAVEDRHTTAEFFNPIYISFASCVLESGLTDAAATVGGQLFYFLSACQVEGPIWLKHPQDVYINDCVIHSTVTLQISERANVTRTRFAGPGACAIDLLGADDNEISNCTFEGFETPIRFGAAYSTLEANNNVFVGPGIVPIQTIYDPDISLRGNRISGFQVGLDMVGSYRSLGAYDNLIEDCGTALRADINDAAFDRNVVRSCGTGVTLRTQGDLRARGNVVQGCGGDGMVIDAGNAVVDSNIVGHCKGAGIRLTTANVYRLTPTRLTANTSYGNAGPGLVVTVTNPSIATSVDHNIGHGNGRFGLEASGAGLLDVSCNDWFANASGTVSGIALASTDLTLDPLFCDVTQEDVHLSAGSPLLNTAGCGSIGALGQGCDRVVSPPPTRFALLGTGPNPSPGSVEATFQLAHAAEITLELFDAQGRRVATLASGSWPAGIHRASWAGSRPASGIYFVRYRHPGGEELRRLAIVR